MKTGKSSLQVMQQTVWARVRKPGSAIKALSMNVSAADSDSANGHINDEPCMEGFPSSRPWPASHVSKLCVVTVRESKKEKLA